VGLATIVTAGAGVGVAGTDGAAGVGSLDKLEDLPAPHPEAAHNSGHRIIAIQGAGTLETHRPRRVIMTQLLVYE
jgi:hypothetical protein